MSSKIRDCQKFLANFLSGYCNLLMPPSCLFCSEPLSSELDGGRFCPKCLPPLVPDPWHGCRRCGQAVLDVGFPISQCLSCLGQSYKFDAAVALGAYDAKLRKAVLRMKRPAHSSLATGMGRLLAAQRMETLAEYQAEMIVPIPMHWRRRLWRGINSPDVVAQCLGKSLGIPVRSRLLVRHRHTQPQASLSPTGRFENMKGAFRVRRPEIVQNARILLVDDILTTGATCHEAAKMLKKAGAQAVFVAVIARAHGKR